VYENLSRERGTPAWTPVEPGTIVAGKYRVDRTLGAGGMGVVLAATQQELDRPVALKFLLPKAMARPDIVARFSREARAAAKIQSEHVARVLDVGALDDGTPFIVMEYLEGEDLATLLRARGPLPCSQAVRYVREACEALAQAHALGIVHRDLKPSNLFLARRPGGRPVVKVVDFGISKFNENEPQQTSDSTLLGSPAYMSPEQLLSARSVDARSDLWALGVVLYELLTGARPFHRERVVEVVADVLHNAPPAVQSLRPDVPPELAGVIHRCLEKQPDRRFPDAGSLLVALAPFADGEPEEAAPKPAGAAAGARDERGAASDARTPPGAGGESLSPTTGAAEAPRAARRRRAWAGAGLAGAAAALVAIAVVSAGSRRTEPVTSGGERAWPAASGAPSPASSSPSSSSSSAPSVAPPDPPPRVDPPPAAASSIDGDAAFAPPAPRAPRARPPASATTSGAAPASPSPSAAPAPRDPLSKLQPM
jgi:tRNA A-37 threonylcarbamoyl transferase component Bud32